MAIICTSKSIPTPPSRYWRSHQHDPRNKNYSVGSSLKGTSPTTCKPIDESSLVAEQNDRRWWELPDLSEISPSSSQPVISRLSESSFSSSSSSSSSSASSSLMDVKRRSSTDTALVGEIVASDAAYVDDFLLSPSVITSHNFDLNEVYLYSERTFKETNPSMRPPTESSGFVISYCHTLRYRGDIVWMFESTCTGGINYEVSDGATATVDSRAAAMGMNGISTTCHLTESSLRVRVNKKGTCSEGRRSLPLASLRRLSSLSCTIRERYDVSLHDILHQSAMKYRDSAAESDHSSFSSLSTN